MKTEPNAPINIMANSEGMPSYTNGDPTLGLTKREYFAAMAMQSIIPQTIANPDISWDAMIEKSVSLADALIQELNK